MRDPLELDGFTAIYYESGESMYLPLAVFDEISSQFEAMQPGDRKIWRGESVHGRSVVVDLARIDTICEWTKAEVARVDELTLQEKLKGEG